MAFQRGDVVLIPFPYTDLSATKTRPALVVSSERYHAVGPDLLVAYVSSQIQRADPDIDHVIVDWRGANLLKPSFVRPKLAAIEPSLVVHRVGALSVSDLIEVDRRLRRALDLVETALNDVLAEIDLSAQPAATVQVLAAESLQAAVALDAAGAEEINLSPLRQLLSNPSP
jgi:mRNA interferase MazF